MTFRLAARLLTAILAGPFTACIAADAPDSVTVRDSAGVTVVENVRTGDVGAPAWRLETPPAARIGVVMGDPRYELAQVRAAFRLDDGTIVVAAAGSEDVRGYDSDGSHLWTVGGRGDGPGEFRNMRSLLRMAGDTLVVVDRFGARITRLLPDGKIIDVALRSAMAGLPLGIFDDHSTVRWVYTGSTPMTQLGRVRNDLAFVIDRNTFLSPLEASRTDAGVTGARFDASTPRVQGDTVLVIPGNDDYRWQLAGGIANEPAAFGRRVAVVTDRDMLHLAGSETFEVRSYASDGALRRIVRLAEPSSALTSAEIERWKTWRRTQVRTPEQEAAVERVIAEQQFPEHRPALSALLIDRQGYLWVERFRTLPDDPQRWVVFDSDGTFAGEVDLPARFTITDAGTDWILGIARDEDDVESIQLFQLSRT